MPAVGVVPLPKFARRNKAALVAAVLVAAALLAAVGVLAVSNVLIARERIRRRCADPARDSAKAAEDQRDRRREREVARDRAEELAARRYFHRITLAHRELSVDNLGRGPANSSTSARKTCGEWEWHYLDAALPGRAGHPPGQGQAEVNSVAFSPDGERLASAGGDGTVKVWNSRTGEVIQTLNATHAAPSVQRRVPPRRQAPGLRRRGPEGEGLGLDDRPDGVRPHRATPFASSGRRTPWRSAPTADTSRREVTGR